MCKVFRVFGFGSLEGEVAKGYRLCFMEHRSHSPESGKDSAICVCPTPKKQVVPKRAA